MRPDHIENHDHRLHMARCPHCGEWYDRADNGCECEEAEPVDDYDPYCDELRQWDESRER